MPRQIALLRGINLGSHKRVSMPRLRELLADQGYADVQTYVQSGNVVLTSDASPADLARELEGHLAADLGFGVDVIVRTRDELADVIARDPFAGVATDPKRYQVTFLADPVCGKVKRALDSADVAPERVAVSGREIYAWHPDGIGRSELASLLSDRRLGAPGTARNWNTVLNLLALADG